jgi:TRAP-type C4-dicarboxylate transport system permease small subunit
MIKFINGYGNFVKKVCWYLCYVSMFLVAVMMVLMTVDALLGKIFSQRILGTFELVQCMLCIIVFSSWAFTQTERGHIHVVMFLRLMPQKLRFICYSITSILSTAIMAFASYAVFNMIGDKIAADERTATLLIPYWPLYVVELVAFIILTFALLADTLKSIAAIVNKDVAEDVMSSWT